MLIWWKGLGTFFEFLILFIPVIIIWKWGKKLNRKKDEVIYVEEETKKEIKQGYHHSLYSIPFEYWAIVMIFFNFIWMLGSIF